MVSIECFSSSPGSNGHRKLENDKQDPICYLPAGKRGLVGFKQTRSFREDGDEVGPGQP